MVPLDWVLAKAFYWLLILWPLKILNALDNAINFITGAGVERILFGVNSVDGKIDIDFFASDSPLKTFYLISIGIGSTLLILFFGFKIAHNLFSAKYKNIIKQSSKTLAVGSIVFIIPAIFITLLSLVSSLISLISGGSPAIGTQDINQFRISNKTNINNIQSFSSGSNIFDQNITNIYNLETGKRNATKNIEKIYQDFESLPQNDSLRILTKKNFQEYEEIKKEIKGIIFKSHLSRINAIINNLKIKEKDESKSKQIKDANNYFASTNYRISLFAKTASQILDQSKLDPQGKKQWMIANYQNFFVNHFYGKKDDIKIQTNTKIKNIDVTSIKSLNVALGILKDNPHGTLVLSNVLSDYPDSSLAVTFYQLATGSKNTDWENDFNINTKDLANGQLFFGSILIIVACGFLVTICFMALVRLIDLALLITISPIPVFIAPIDGGERVSLWIKAFSEELLSILGAIIVLRLLGPLGTSYRNFLNTNQGFLGDRKLFLLAFFYIASLIAAQKAILTIASIFGIGEGIFASMNLDRSLGFMASLKGYGRRASSYYYQGIKQTALKAKPGYKFSKKIAKGLKGIYNWSKGNHNKSSKNTTKEKFFYSQKHLNNIKLELKIYSKTGKPTKRLFLNEIGKYNFLKQKNQNLNISIKKQLIFLNLSYFKNEINSYWMKKKLNLSNNNYNKFKKIFNSSPRKELSNKDIRFIRKYLKSTDFFPKTRFDALSAQTIFHHLLYKKIYLNKQTILKKHELIYKKIIDSFYLKRNNEINLLTSKLIRNEKKQQETNILLEKFSKRLNERFDINDMVDPFKIKGTNWSKDFKHDYKILMDDSYKNDFTKSYKFNIINEIMVNKKDRNHITNNINKIVNELDKRSKTNEVNQKFNIKKIPSQEIIERKTKISNTILRKINVNNEKYPGPEIKTTTIFASQRYYNKLSGVTFKKDKKLINVDLNNKLKKHIEKNWNDLEIINKLKKPWAREKRFSFFERRKGIIKNFIEKKRMTFDEWDSNFPKFRRKSKRFFTFDPKTKKQEPIINEKKSIKKSVKFSDSSNQPLEKNVPKIEINTSYANDMLSGIKILQDYANNKKQTIDIPKTMGIKIMNPPSELFSSNTIQKKINSVKWIEHDGNENFINKPFINRNKMNNINKEIENYRKKIIENIKNQNNYNEITKLHFKISKNFLKLNEWEKAHDEIKKTSYYLKNQPIKQKIRNKIKEIEKTIEKEEKNQNDLFFNLITKEKRLLKINRDLEVYNDSLLKAKEINSRSKLLLERSQIYYQDKNYFEAWNDLANINKNIFYTDSKIIKSTSLMMNKIKNDPIIKNNPSLLTENIFSSPTSFSKIKSKTLTEIKSFNTYQKKAKEDLKLRSKTIIESHEFKDEYLPRDLNRRRSRTFAPGDKILESGFLESQKSKITKPFKQLINKVTKTKVSNFDEYERKPRSKTVIESHEFNDEYLPRNLNRGRSRTFAPGDKILESGFLESQKSKITKPFKQLINKVTKTKASNFDEYEKKPRSKTVIESHEFNDEYLPRNLNRGRSRTFAPGDKILESGFLESQKSKITKPFKQLINKVTKTKASNFDEYEKKPRPRRITEPASFSLEGELKPIFKKERSRTFTSTDDSIQDNRRLSTINEEKINIFKNKSMAENLDREKEKTLKTIDRLEEAGLSYLKQSPKHAFLAIRHQEEANKLKEKNKSWFVEKENDNLDKIHKIILDGVELLNQNQKNSKSTQDNKNTSKLLLKTYEKTLKKK